MNILPILAKHTSGMELVEVDGQAVVTAQNLAAALEYKSEKAVRRIFTRNRKAFRDYGVYDMTRVSQFDAPFSDSKTRGGQIDTPLSNSQTRVCHSDIPFSDSKTRGHQSDEPFSDDPPDLPRHIDTALIRMLTPSAADGRGGGLQDVRVFTKRGALKVCMKSNQPKAVMVQERLIDLYEQVESGQLVGATRFTRAMEALAGHISELQRDVAHLKRQPPISLSLPDDTALPIAIERKRGRSFTLTGALKHTDVRLFVTQLRQAGYHYMEIAAACAERWPNDPGKHPSKSAIGRFWQAARTGRLKEYNIDVTVH